MPLLNTALAWPNIPHTAPLGAQGSGLSPFLTPIVTLHILRNQLTPGQGPMAAHLLVVLPLTGHMQSCAPTLLRD